MEITAGARASPLSRAQAEEVLKEIRAFQSEVIFSMVWVETRGDTDRAVSLRSLGKDDFFTRELDEMLLRGEVRIAIHSAKDLPEPLPKGLALAALTRGLDPGDSLVLREGRSLETLPSNALIATSSLRREEAVRSLRPDLRFQDLRGTIGERIEKLTNGEADGVVVAEAALIRLKWTHLNRVRLPGPTVPFQGRLAVVAREEDLEMQALFEPIHAYALSRT